MSRAKLVIIAVCAVLSLVIVLQNTQDVRIRLLGIKIEMPLIVLLVVMLLLGITIGVSSVLWRKRR